MGVAYPGGGRNLGGATGGGRLQGYLVLLPLDLLQLHGHLLDGRYPLSPVGGAGGGAYTWVPTPSQYDGIEGIDT